MHRNTDTQTDRQSDRQAYIQTHTDGIQPDKQTYMQTCAQRQTERYIHTEKKTGRQIDRL